MKRAEAEKLLGGHATGTLTGEEQKILYAAALGHQAIFDALMDEERLRELLANPEAKAQLLAALSSAPPKVVPFWRRTGVLGAAASLIVAATAGLAYLRSPDKTPPPLDQGTAKITVAKSPDQPAAKAAPVPAKPVPASPMGGVASGAPAPEIQASKKQTAESLKEDAALSPVAAAPAPAAPAQVVRDVGSAAAPGVSVAKDAAAKQEDFRRVEARSNLVAKKAEAPKPARAAAMEAAGALAPSAAAKEKLREREEPSSDKASVPAPTWSLNPLPDGHTRVLVSAPNGSEIVLLRRGASGVEVLNLLMEGKPGSALARWHGRVRLVEGDALDLYVLNHPVSKPAELPATGAVDGFRARIHPASK